MESTFFRKAWERLRPGRRGLALGALLAGLVLLAVAWGVGNRVRSAEEYDRAVEAVREWNLPSGSHLKLALPEPFRRLSEGGKVDVFKAGNGRLFVLFRTAVGWKGNYTGLLYADGGLSPADLASDYYGRTTVRLGVPVVEQPVLGRTVKEGWYIVLEDLG